MISISETFNGPPELSVIIALLDRYDTDGYSSTEGLQDQGQNRDSLAEGEILSTTL